jgi:hypothetical protein
MKTMTEPKLIDIREFVEQGFLQEVNRVFLHSHGLALSITINDDGSYELKGIWDYREDPEGIIYDLKNSNKERLERFRKNRDNVYAEFQKHENARNKLFDVEYHTYGIEPIPTED